MSERPFRVIGLTKEIESPENPGGLEKRVALTPDGVAQLVAHGCEVAVETGAGARVGFDDAAYIAAGARLQDGADIYRDKELLIKFKGPALETIPLMHPGTTLFCMAHFHSYPARAQLLEAHQINVIAMEEIREYPEYRPDTLILGRMAVDNCLEPHRPRWLDVHVFGWTERLNGAIRRLGRRRPRSLTCLHPDTRPEALTALGPDALYFYDAHDFTDPHGVLRYLQERNCLTYNLAEFEQRYGPQAVFYYNATVPPKQFGKRRIQCLHETGRAGARYGLQLLVEESGRRATPEQANVVVLGYGNVALGAVDECLHQGVRQIAILTEQQTRKRRITQWLQQADLIINGADLPQVLHGKRYLITKEHMANVIPKGAVLIDLIGGSPTNRSPVESVLSCTFLTDPFFIEEDIYISALWGWPMMGMMRETTIKYSGQIVEVLLGEQERLIDGLAHLTPGVERALVCGPFTER